MEISGACADFLLEETTFRKDGVFAGADLLSQDTLGIYVHRSEQIPASLADEFEKISTIGGGRKEILPLDVPFRDERAEQDLIIDSFRTRYQGSIKFVGADENPDVVIASFSSSSLTTAVGSMPSNDTVSDFNHLSVQFLLVNSDISTYQILAEDDEIRDSYETTLPHEVGHIFAFGHSINIRLANLLETTGKGAPEIERDLQEHDRLKSVYHAACSGPEREIAENSVMSYSEERSFNEVDRLLLNRVRLGMRH